MTFANSLDTDRAHKVLDTDRAPLIHVVFMKDIFGKLPHIQDVKMHTYGRYVMYSNCMQAM